jgi:hypothetical protein
MPDAKIEFKVGTICFSGEGSEQWLSAELGKALDRIPELSKIAPNPTAETGSAPPTAQKLGGTLVTFLREKGAATNQVRKFLATAAWIHEHDNKPRLTTKDVTSALSESSQGRLTNPSDCLNQNVAKGFCEKENKQFYVTEEGRAKLA